MANFNIDAFEKLFILEKHRIASYKSWPFDKSANCNIEKMSEAGFYWCGNEKENDTATCFACHKVLDGWESTDDPWTEHMKHAPQCIFVKYGKPESKLTIEQFLELVESITKNSLHKKRVQIIGKLETLAAKKREKFIKSFDK